MGMDSKHLNRNLLERAMNAYKNEAHERRESAGFNGGMDDGGAREMEDRLAAYRTGLAGELPDFLAGHYAQLEREQDPEYAEYKRLLAKFGEDKQ